MAKLSRRKDCNSNVKPHLHAPNRTPLRVLILDDNERDADLTIRSLTDTGLQLSAITARNAEEFKRFVKNLGVDLILGDYRVPGWSGLEAIRWLRTSGIATPFILVTGPLGDELATDCIKAGADDYVIKENINRLPIAVRRTLAEQVLRAERDWAEEQLRQSEKQYRLLFSSNPNPMWVFDIETLRFLAVNNAAVHHYGYSESEFLAMIIEDLWPTSETPQLLRRHKECRVGHTPRYKEILKHRKRDGTIIDVEISDRPVSFGGVSAKLVMANDVTEHRRLERQFRYVQKMEAVGRLAGGIAHDFNNLMMVISSHTELVKANLSDPGRACRYIAQINNAIDKASLLTMQLLAFGRKQPQDLKVLDLNRAVNEIGKMLPPLFGSSVEIITKCLETECPVLFDEAQIEQVIMNLAVNARDAMPKGGRLTIETRLLTLEREYFPSHGMEAKPGEYVMLSVTDTGEGMDANTSSRIFEPFFTTKQPEKGTGLGLSTVYGIVKQNDGYIWVYSELGVGTTFKVYLPHACSPIDRSNEVPRKDEESEIATGEAILLVEDEPALRTATCEFLKTKGYRVLTAANGMEALKIAVNEHNLDLLLTDLVMPGLGGAELATQIRKMVPAIGVIFMSGYMEQAARPVSFEQANFYIQKPFAFSALSSVIRRVLENQVPSSSANR